MTKFETLAITQDARGVVRLELNLPDKRNAMSALMIAELTRFATEVANMEGARAVVLSGRGKMFCAGGDLAWMQAQMAADRETRMAEARKLAMMLKALNEMPLPLIGQLHGGAFGGGVGLACICDVVLAEEGMKFGLTETKLGLIPATIGPYVLARMGEGHARRVFMSARLFEAAEARDLGIVSKVVASSEMEAAVEAEIAPYLSVAPGAVGAAKALARKLGAAVDYTMIDHSIAQLAEIWEGEEAREGITAFFEKRKASWVIED